MKNTKRKKPHEHTLKRIGMTAYCRCGFSINFKCAHRWKFEKKVPVQLEKLGGIIRQEQEYYTCKSCGAVRMTNITSGTTAITDR